MPVGAGTPRCENRELWFGTANRHGGFCHAPPRPQRGTSPRATFSHSAIGHRSTIRQVSPVESRDGGRLEGASRIGVRDMLSCQSLMPAGAGTPRYEKPELWFGTANRHGGFCHAPPRPQRGTSPSRYDPLSPPLWIPAFAGMRNRGAGMTRTRNGGVQRRDRKRRRRIFVRMTTCGLRTIEMALAG